MLPPLPKPLLLAHRGASACAPENTLAAFQLAMQQGAHGVELDAKLSADGEMVVMHDDSVDRTTNGCGKVNELPLAALRELRPGGRFSDRFPEEKIPTLIEVLETLGRQAIINIELTNYSSPRDGLPELAAGLVERMEMQANVLFSSFLPANLKRVRRRLPQARVAILALPGLAGWPGRGWFGRSAAPEIVHPHHSNVTPTFVQQEHARGRRVHAWTVNDPRAARAFLLMGIDGLISDDPPAVLKVMEELA
jgi:glycerophosphoryl diester phosphodiesterase